MKFIAYKFYKRLDISYEKLLLRKSYETMIKYDINSLNIDEEKKIAIKTIEGPLLIIAGPGSGKTKTLVERIIYLISKGTKADEILVATFTEKAAKELITRVSNRLLELNLKINLNEMYIGTLHSIFLRFLDENKEYTRLKRNYRMLDQFDQAFFIFSNLKEFTELPDVNLLFENPMTPKWAKANKLLSYINTVGEECIDTNDLICSEEAKIRAIGHAYNHYQGILEDENALDFSFIQVETLKLLKNTPNILEEIQEKIKYIMVDEYQDTNTIQERIILLLANKHNNICVVGDDDQGLYRFRGATIRNILEFANNFETNICKKVTLTTNYRSQPGIIQLYNTWMNQLNWTEDNKKFRFDKTIKPREYDFPKTSSVIKVSNDQTVEEYHEEVYNFIINLEKEGTLKDRNQIAFLFRSVKNYKVIALAEYLESKNIKIFSPRSALFFDREEIKLMIGAFIFIFPGLFEILKWSDKAKLEIWDYYIDCANLFAETIQEDKEKHKTLLTYCLKKVQEHRSLTKNTNYGFAALLYQLLEYPMFSNFLDTELNADKTDLRPSYNLALLTKLLSKYEFLYNVTVLTPANIEFTLKNLFNVFLRFIYDGGIEEYEDFEEFAPSGCVSFMTIHQSKGLEFPIVVVGMPNSHQGPRTQYTDIDELLQNDYYSKPPFEPLEKTKFYDFWRLYYTAFSRSQNLLVLSCNEKKNKQGEYSCPYKSFKNIYENIPSWKDKDFDPTMIKLEKINPIHIKKEYSFTSHILLYENCPLQYKFYKELEFTEVRVGAAIGGQLLHQTIEDIHKAVLRGEESSLNNENIECWFNSNYYLLSKQTRGYLQSGQLRSLLKQVFNYRDKQSNDWDKIKEAEVDVSLVKEDYILKGTIDLVRGEKDTVEIIDFKSGSKPNVNATDGWTKRTLNTYRRQLEIYAFLVEERTGQEVSKMHLYYPKEENSSPYITFNKNNDIIHDTIKSFDNTVNKIIKKDFSCENIIKNDKQCSDCDMRFYCNPRQYK